MGRNEVCDALAADAPGNLVADGRGAGAVAPREPRRGGKRQGGGGGDRSERCGRYVSSAPPSPTSPPSPASPPLALDLPVPRPSRRRPGAARSSTSPPRLGPFPASPGSRSAAARPPNPRPRRGVSRGRGACPALVRQARPARPRFLRVPSCSRPAVVRRAPRRVAAFGRLCLARTRGGRPACLACAFFFISRPPPAPAVLLRSLPPARSRPLSDATGAGAWTCREARSAALGSLDAPRVSPLRSRRVGAPSLQKSTGGRRALSAALARARAPPPGGQWSALPAPRRSPRPSRR